MSDEISPIGREPWSRKRKAAVWLICGGAVVGLIWLTSQPSVVVSEKPVAADKVGDVGEGWSPIPRDKSDPPPPKPQGGGFTGFNGQQAQAGPVRVPIVAFQAGGQKQEHAGAAAPAGSAGRTNDGLTERLSAGSDMDTAVATMLPDRNLFITMGTPMGCSTEQPINTDVPGPFRCKVRRPVYSTSSNVPLLDAGTWIVGDISQPLARGSKRAFAVMHRIETPQGCIVRLRAPIGDAMGEAGLPGEIETHFWERFRGYALIGLLDAASQAAGLAAAKALSGNNGNLTLNQFGNVGGQLGQQTFGDDTAIPSTLRSNQAQRIVVIAMQDIDFPQLLPIEAALMHEAIPLLQESMSVFQPWLAETDVEDILINRAGEAFVRRGATMTRYDIPHDAVDLEGIAILAGSLKGQNISRDKPILSCDLPGGIRLQAVLPPCAKDVALAIRRPRGSAPSLDDLTSMFSDIQTRAGMVSDEDQRLLGLYRAAQGAAEREGPYKVFLRAAMKARKTTVLCGTVGTGKTTFAMGLIREIPLDDRLALVQDADEWAAIHHQNKVELFYSKGLQGGSQVTANDLVEASLRLAMTWLCLQELRGAEAFSFLRARRSGHPSVTTMHSDSARDVFPALALMARQHPAMASVDLDIIEAAFRGLIDCVVHLHRPGGQFRISEIWFRPAEG